MNVGMGDDEETYYDVLEVHEDATSEEIRTARNRLLHEYHPDKVPEHLGKLRKDAEQRTILLTEAYDVLSDPAKRNRYDDMLRMLRAPARPAPQGAPVSSPPPPPQPPNTGTGPPPPNPNTSTAPAGATASTTSSPRPSHASKATRAQPRSGTGSRSKLKTRRTAVLLCLLVATVVLGMQRWGNLPSPLRALTIIAGVVLAVVVILSGVALTFGALLALAPILLIAAGIGLGLWLGTIGWIVGLILIAIGVGMFFSLLRESSTWTDRGREYDLRKTLRPMGMGALWIGLLVGGFWGVRALVLYRTDQRNRPAAVERLAAGKAVADAPRGATRYGAPDTFSVMASPRDDAVAVAVEEGDRITIVDVNDFGVGIELGGWFAKDRSQYQWRGNTHVTEETRGPMPWPMVRGGWSFWTGQHPKRVEPPNPRNWRTLKAPYFWPLLAVKRPIHGISQWYPVEEDTVYTLSAGGQLVFGVNLMTSNVQFDRQHSGDWKITYTVEHKMD